MNCLQAVPAFAASNIKAANELVKTEVVAPGGFRKSFFLFVDHPWFDRCILLCIMVNCFFMAIQDPVKVKGEIQGALYFDLTRQDMEYVELVLLWTFSLESLVKNVAFTPWGYFFGPDASWNRLDFLVCWLGWLETNPSLLGNMPFNISFLRIFRVLRPLRTLQRIEGMKSLINTILNCVERLEDVIVLTVFCFFVFSVAAMDLFGGGGSQRCLDVNTWDEGTQTGAWYVLPDEYTSPLEERRCGGDFKCPDYMGTKYKCYHAGRNPGEGVLKQNQADGIIGYDNLGQAMFTVFVFCTLEGWVDGMYQVQDSFGWAAARIFHTLLILVGTFFCLNLALAVIADTFEDEAAAKAEHELEENEARAAEEKTEEANAKEANGPAAEESVRSGYTSLEESGGTAIDSGPVESPGNVQGENEEVTEIYGVRPTNPVLSVFYSVSISPAVNYFVLFLIFLNTVTLAMERAEVKCLPLVDMDTATWASLGNYTGSVPECIVQADVMDSSLQSLLTITNIFFVVAFALESAVKIVGLNPGYYFKDPFNAFDFVIVIVSLVEMLLKAKGMTALRCFRLARLFKTARSWGSLRAIIESLLNVLPSMASLTLMLVLYMFMSAVAGMQILGDYLPFENRSRFTDFGIAMLTIFQMLTGENWNEVCFDAITSTGDYYVVVYFVVVVCVGNFLVLNLFLAIMLSDFNCGEPPDFSLNTMIKTAKACLPAAVGRKPYEDEEKLAQQESGAEEKTEDSEWTGTNPPVKNDSDSSVPLRKVSEKNDSDSSVPLRKVSINKKEEMVKAGVRGSVEVVRVLKSNKAEERQAKLAARFNLEGTSLGCLGENNPFRRYCMYIVRHPYFENIVLLCIIVSSILLACDGPTNDSTTPLWEIIGYIDFAFVVLFTVEATLKIVVNGACDCPQGYFRDPWNILDFAIVIVGWVAADYSFFSVGGGGSGVGALRTLRSLRALRPLRTIQRLPGMRLVVSVLFECTPVFINICFVVLFVFTVFATMGVQFFAGRFWTCNDPGVNRVDECWGCFVDEEGTNPSGNCLPGSSEREWSNLVMNFDNVWTSLLTLYEVAGLEMWLDVMYAAMDTRPSYTRNAHGSSNFPYGAQPRQEENWPAAFFFVIFILIGVFIVLNLFVGAVVDKFNELKEAAGGSLLQTKEQAQYSDTMRLMARMRPYVRPVPPKRPSKKLSFSSLRQTFHTFRLKCYALVMWDTSGKEMGTTFDLFVSGLVTLNILVMGLGYWKRLPDGAAYEVGGDAIVDFQSTYYQTVLGVVNDVFSFIFLLEFFLKWAAWGFRQYMLDTWNRLDFFLVSISMVGFVLEQALSSLNSASIDPNVFRIARFARISRSLKSLRMIKHIKGVADLVDTLVFALPSIANVASLCILVIFIFTVMGMDFYGYDFIDAPYINGMYNRHANFRYFGDGFMLLSRAVTGEAWNGIMHDMMVAECDPKLDPSRFDKGYDAARDYDEHYCGAPHKSVWIFFVLFMTFVTGLLFELITAIVLDEFGKMNDDDSALPVPKAMIEEFNEEWALLDPMATQYIPQHKLLPFFKAIDPPIFSPNPAVAAKQFFAMSIASVPGRDGVQKVHFVDVLMAFMRHMFIMRIGSTVGEDLDVALLELPELSNTLMVAYPNLRKVEKREHRCMTTDVAATKVQNLWQKRAASKAAKAKRQKLIEEVCAITGEDRKILKTKSAYQLRKTVANSSSDDVAGTDRNQRKSSSFSHNRSNLKIGTKLDAESTSKPEQAALDSSNSSQSSIKITPKAGAAGATAV